MGYFPLEFTNYFAKNNGITCFEMIKFKQSQPQSFPEMREFEHCWMTQSKNIEWEIKCDII